jgi:hypothetical protein
MTILQHVLGGYTDRGSFKLEQHTIFKPIFRCNASSIRLTREAFFPTRFVFKCEVDRDPIFYYCI